MSNPTQQQHSAVVGPHSTTFCMLWGFVDGRKCCGKVVTGSFAEVWVRGCGWNLSTDPPDRLLQSLPSLPGQTAPPAPQQLSIGWSHALVLRNGKVYLHNRNASALKQCAEAAACGRHIHRCGSTTAVASPPEWQLLHFPKDSPAMIAASLGRVAALLPASAQQQVTQVAAGDDHCLLLTAAGGVWALGSNRYGQVGCGNQPEMCNQHQQHATSSGVEQQQHTIHSGVEQRQQQHTTSLAVEQQQQQHPMQRDEVQQPVLVLGPRAGDGACQDAIVQVAAGSCHSAAITRAGGRLYCWGWNGHGQCCTGTSSDLLQPTLCAALDGVPLVAVAAGLAHTLCVSRDGAVYACGCNSNGQLGTARGVGNGAAAAAGWSPVLDTPSAEVDTWAAATPGARVHMQGWREAESVGQYALHTGPTLQQRLVGNSTLRPFLVEDPALDDAHVIQVSCGTRHSVVLTAAGVVLAWGWNKYGQCCSGEDVPNCPFPRQLVSEKQLNEQQPHRSAVTTTDQGRTAAEAAETWHILTVSARGWQTCILCGYSL